MGRDKVKTPHNLNASIADIISLHADGVRTGRLAALREVREMVLTVTVRDGCTAMRIAEKIDAMIAREEGR